MILGVSLAGYPWAPNPDGWQEHKTWIGKHCDVVGLPMPYWSQLEPTRGAWDPAPFGQLDGIVDEARRMGIKVFLFMTGWPTWATAQHRTRTGGKWRVSPDNLDPGGPWSYYLWQVLKHFAGRVEWVAPLNEVNFAFWDEPTMMAKDTATMMRTAADVAQYIPGAPMLLMPAVLDADIGGQSNWRTFTEAVLTELKGWAPPQGVRVGWAYHPYSDLADGVSTRTQTLLDLLEKHGWHDGRRVYATEGGTTFSAVPAASGSNHYVYSNAAADEIRQRNHLARFYSWTAGWAQPKINGEVVLGMHWTRQDMTQGHWKSGLVSYDGVARAIVPLWQNVRSR